MSWLPGAGSRLGTVITAGCHQSPHHWGPGGSRRAANPGWVVLHAGMFSNLPEVTRQRGHVPPMRRSSSFPSRETTVQA